MLNQVTQSLYNQHRKRGQWNRLRALLTRRSADLFNLTDIEKVCTVRERCYAGAQTVSIRQIQGSENRTGDFDRDFNPLRDHNEQRWQKIAALWLEGQGLPLIELIQVGDIYFVRDGHHRISVARALGQQDIEAGVTVWQVDKPLPWQQPTTEECSNMSFTSSFAAQLRLSLETCLMAIGQNLRPRPQAKGTTSGH